MIAASPLTHAGMRSSQPSSVVHPPCPVVARPSFTQALLTAQWRQWAQWALYLGQPDSTWTDANNILHVANPGHGRCLIPAFVWCRDQYCHSDRIYTMGLVQSSEVLVSYINKQKFMFRGKYCRRAVGILCDDIAVCSVFIKFCTFSVINPKSTE